MSGGPPPPPEPPPPAPARVEEHRFPCAACGSDLRFAPEAGQMVCPHCGSTQAVPPAAPWSEAKALAERDYATALRGALPEADMEVTRVAHCDSCGADVDFDSVTEAKECPFCASPMVAVAAEHRQIRPTALLPFAVTEAAAREAMRAWLGRLWFAPNGLQQYARKGRRMTGIYVPYWTFDADTRSAYRGERGDDYWTTERRIVNGKSKNVRVKKTRWTRVSGRVARRFDDVLALASRALPRAHTDALEPWDLGALTPYRPEFLAGFRAESYQVGLAEGHDIARARMDDVIRQDVRRDIGGDHQRIHGIDTEARDITFKHVLLPVWLAAYKYRGESYRFVVNGRTGKVSGERPWSAWKIALAVLAAAILGGVALWLWSMAEQGQF